MNFNGTPSATGRTISTFGVLAALAGIEHGIGEVLQGNTAPEGLVIESWPDTEAFRILNGEPAMTIVPNPLATGILAILASLAFLVWAMRFVQREHGALGLLLLSGVMLLLGAGFGPPLLGVILGITATSMKFQKFQPATPSASARHFPASLWAWFFGASLTAWLMLFPGSIIVALLTGADETSSAFGTAVAALTLSAFGLLLLTIVAGLMCDGERQSNLQRSSGLSESGA